jgi:hypothetical protein
MFEEDTSAIFPNQMKILLPEYSEWQVELMQGTVLRPLKGREPNAFHRFMQSICFGFVWRKVR